MLKHWVIWAASAVAALAGCVPAVAQSEINWTEWEDAYRAGDFDPADYPELWREVPPEDLIVFQTSKGPIVVELFPELAPNHVERILTLVNRRFYDFTYFYRVIPGFVSQGGASKTGVPQPTNLPNLEPEFVLKRGEDFVFEIYAEQTVNPSKPGLGSAPVGWRHGVRMGSQNPGLIPFVEGNAVDRWIMHCGGTASMARTSVPNSANSQIFLLQGASPWLDTEYSAWGEVRRGLDVVLTMEAGEPPQNPDVIRQVRHGAELATTGQAPKVWVMNTETVEFRTWLATQVQDYANRENQAPGLCEFAAPSIVVMPRIPRDPPNTSIENDGQ